MAVRVFHNRGADVYPFLATGDVVSDVGGLVGSQNGGGIAISYSTGDITLSGQLNEAIRDIGSATNIGGLVGSMTGAIIRGSFATGTIDISYDTTVDYVGGLIGRVTGGNIFHSYSGASFELSATFRVNQQNVGLMFGNIGNASRVANSYTHSEHSKIANFAWGDATVESSHYINSPSSGSSDDSLAATNTTIEQLQSCGLDGALPGAVVNCTGIFGAGWEPRVVSNAQVSWVFDPHNFYPRLKAVDLTTGVDDFPSPYEQHCFTAICSPALEQISFTQDVYNFIVTDLEATPSNVLGTVGLTEPVSGAEYSISARTDINFLAIDPSSGAITLTQTLDTAAMFNGSVIDVLVRDATNTTYDVASARFIYYGDISGATNDTDSDGIADLYDSAPNDTGVMGAGTPADPYIIFNIYQLQAIAGVDHHGIALDSSLLTQNQFIYGNSKQEQLAAHYQLGNDIDARGNATDNAPFNFLPIGDCGRDTNCRADSILENPFVGSFHGKGYVISNLLIDQDRGANGQLLQPMGLFGQLSGKARIIGVGLDNAILRGWYVTGTLVGLMNSGTISQSHVINSRVEIKALSNTPAPSYNGGGMVGVMHSGIIKYSYSSNTVVNWVGNFDDQDVTFDVDKDLFLGGMVGNMLGGTMASVYTINNNLLVSKLPSKNAYLGGLAGTIEGATIEGSYSVPRVSIQGLLF